MTNAIENILSVAKKKEEDPDWLKKKDFGRIPDYLNRIKENIQTEYKMIQNLHMQNSDEKYFCSYWENVWVKKKFERSEKGWSESGTK